MRPMSRFSLWLAAALLLLAPVFAQDAPPPADLVIAEQTLTVRPDIYGLPALYVEGVLANQGRDAYQDIVLLAEVYDADDALIGEGFGFPVTLCGAGLLPSFALQPGEAQTFDVALELYDLPGGDADDADAPDLTAGIARVALSAQGRAVPAEVRNPFLTFDSLTTLSDREVVAVEWIDAARLRFGVGCFSDPFTLLDWYEYDPETGEVAAAEHPRAESLTPTVLARLNLSDRADFRHAFLYFHPDDRRMVYQNAINTLLTAEPNGTFQRLLWDELAPYSLQGYSWLPEGRFMAYYYGAFGDPVRYFTASTAGQRISAALINAVPSVTVPGVTPDGVRAVIATTRDGVTGYYLTSLLNQATTLLFEAEPPGNNWPAPVYVPRAGGEAVIYIIRPVDGQARLECFDTATGTLSSLALLPLQLTQDARARAWLAPDSATLAVGASGQRGGLWLVDLTRFSACAA